MLCAAAGYALVGCGGLSGGSGGYTIADLSNKFVATGINNRGQIVGEGNGAAGGPVLWQNGQAVDVNTLLPSSSGWQLQSSAGINDNGDIVGYGTLNGDPLHGYLLKKGAGGSYTITDLSNKFVATGVNNEDQIVGGGNGATGGPILWQNGQAVDLNTLLPSNSGWQLQSAAGINNRGEIVGYGTLNGQVKHAYRLLKNPNGGYTTADLGGQFVATGINDQDQIVGGGNGASGGPVLWQNQGLIDVNSLLPAGSGWLLQSASGIDNSGDIVGYGTLGGQLLHAYLLKRR